MMILLGVLGLVLVAGIGWGIYGWWLGQLWIGRDLESGWPYIGIWIL